jgi:hypothetical protein
MTLELTSEQEAVIQRIALQEGKSPVQVVAEAFDLLESIADDRAEELLMDEREREAYAGVDWISEEEMDVRFQAMLRPR